MFDRLLNISLLKAALSSRIYVLNFVDFLEKHTGRIDFIENIQTVFNHRSSIVVATGDRYHCF